MATVQDMREHIKSDLVLVGTVYDAQIENAIRSALRGLRAKKYWFLETASTITLPTTANSVSLPDDYAAPGSFDIIVQGNRYSDNNGFDFLMYENLKSLYWNQDPIMTGSPIACAVLGGTLYTSHIADTNYTIPLSYYRKDATLPTSAETSIWFDDGYDAVRSAAQFIFKRDSMQFTASEEDGALARMYMGLLDEQHRKIEVGR